MLNVLSTAGASILGRRLPDPDHLLRLVAGSRRRIAGDDPWGARGLEWEIPSPPPTENFAVTPDRDASARTSTAPEPGGRHCLTRTQNIFQVRFTSRPSWPTWRRSSRTAGASPHHPQLQHHFDDMAQQAEASTLGMWVFLVTEIMFFGGLFMAYLVYRHAVAGGVPEASHHLNITWGAVNTVVLIVSSLTMALAVRAAQTSAPRKTQVGWIWRDDGPRRRVPRGQGDRVHRQVHASPGSRAELPLGRAVSGAGGDVLLAVLLHDRAARAAHDHRARHHDGHRRSWRGRNTSTRTTTRRSKSRACTGTSSTSCGFSCSRCSTSSAATSPSEARVMSMQGHVAATRAHVLRGVPGA